MIKLHFHADSDGVVSAFFVSKELDRLSIKYSLHPSLGAYVEMQGKHNVSLDISTIKSASIFNFSIDHHVADKAQHFYVNPRKSGFGWPVCFLTYAMFGDKTESWIAAVGIVADWCSERVPSDFWEIVKSQHPELVPEVNQQTLVDDKLGDMALMIDCTIAKHRSKGAKMALKALKDAKSYKTFFNGKGSAKELKENKAEILEEVNGMFGCEDVHKEFVLIEFDSPYRIKSLVAAMAKKRHPNKLLVIVQKDRDKMRLSFRQGDDLDKLVKTLTKDIGDGGGHPKASGGFVETKHYEKFKTRLNEKFK